MRNPIFWSAAALILAAPAVQAQQTGEMPPDHMHQGMEHPADPAMPATPATPAPPSAPADPNASVPPAPVANDPAMQPAAPGVPHDPSAQPGSPANPVVEGGNMTAPPPPRDHYPICRGAVQDSCMNPGEAPKGYGKKRK